MLLGWVRAILLQFAHPLIAAGVADHSSFRGGMGAALAVASHRRRDARAHLAARTIANARWRAIRTIHRRVHGSLSNPAAVSPPALRIPPRIPRCCSGCMRRSSIRSFGCDRLVAPLSDTDRDAYCVDAAEVAIALGARPGRAAIVARAAGLSGRAMRVRDHRADAGRGCWRRRAAGTFLVGHHGARDGYRPARGCRDASRAPAPRVWI